MGVKKEECLLVGKQRQHTPVIEPRALTADLC